MPDKPKVVDGLGYGEASGETECQQKRKQHQWMLPDFRPHPPCDSNPIYVSEGSVLTPVSKRTSDYCAVLHICQGGPQHT